MTLTSASGQLPVQPFFSTPQQRLALARQRYFEEGVRPSGLLGEGVIQSWTRCTQARRDPSERIAFNPVTTSRIHSTLQRSRLLMNSAGPELEQLQSTLSGTACSAILTDAHGVVVHAIHAQAAHDAVLLPLASRVGVDLHESQIGTAAPGITLRTGQSSVVMGGEHYFGCLQVLHCAAAPIRDIHGQVAGVLDVSSEGRPFGFDAGAVVGLYATTIENRLLRAQSDEHLVVQLQTSPALLDTPMEGLAGIDAQGRIAWVNAAAARLLGLAGAAVRQHDVEQTFGVAAAALLGLTRHTAARPHRLPNGLTVWLQAHLQARNGAGPLVHVAPALAPAPPAHVQPAQPASPARAPAPTLRDNDRRVVEQTVRECGGNISKAARALGVSRGLVYRHLKGTARRGG